MLIPPPAERAHRYDEDLPDSHGVGSVAHVKDTLHPKLMHKNKVHYRRMRTLSDAHIWNGTSNPCTLRYSVMTLMGSVIAINA